MSRDYISTAPLDNNYLAHYGIKGQKWGIRRFQNPDGTLTTEGLKRYGSVKEMKKAVKAEYKQDQAKAKKLGDEASIAAWAAKMQSKKYKKALIKYEKNPENLKNKRRLSVERDVRRYFAEGAHLSKARAEAHYNEMVKKYGQKAMKDIRYAKDGSIDERNNATGLNILSSIIAGVSAFGMIAMGSPIGVGVAHRFSSNKEKAREIQSNVRYEAYKLYDQHHK